MGVVVRHWLARQLADPTSALHAHGFAFLWWGVCTDDTVKLAAAFACFVGGGSIDLVQTFLSKRP